MAQELDDVRLNAKEADVFVVAGFTAEPLQNFLAEQLSGYGIASTINFAPFGQVFQSLLNQDAGLRTHAAGINLLLLRAEDFFCLADRQALQEHRFNDANLKAIEQLQDSLVATLTELDVAYPGKFVVALCPSLLELVTQDGHDNSYLLALESRLLEKLASLSVAPIVPADFYVGHSSEVFDLVRDEIAKIPFRDSYFPLLAQVIATRIANFHGFEHKLIVLDADGTLWQGICGEQEPDTLVITRDQLYLQNLVRKAKQQGMLLALVSKNNPADVERVFEENTSMVLQRDDFIAMRVNWQSKAKNIAEIAAELNLSSSSFIFIDDNAVELVEVGAAHPGLLLLPIPQTSDDEARNSLRSLTAVLERSWLFQRLAVTEEDTRRTQLYQLEQQRKHLQSSFGDLASFIQNLGIEVRFYPLDAGNMNRAAQLSAKTNQFNLRKIPRSQDELQSIIEKKNTSGFIVQVQDKFGDYGQTGVVVLVADSAANSVSTLIVDTFLLSCRVLGRHIEYCVLQKIRQHAESLQCTQVHFPLVRSDKNAPVQLFLDKYFAQYADAGNVEKTGHTVLDYLIPVEALAKLEVPQSIVIRDEISGLVDAQATGQPGSNAVSLAELNSISELLCRLVRKNLALEDKVLASDNYFSLGGNSLKAVNLIVDSRKEGLSYTLDDVIGSATIADIARLVRREHAQFASVTTVAPFALLDDAEKHEVDDRYDLLELDDAFPLSSLQQGMIYHSLKEKDLHLYQNVLCWHVQSGWNEKLFIRALRAMQVRHEALRSVFVMDAVRRPLQVVMRNAPAPLQTFNLRALSKADQDAEIRQWVAEQKQQGIAIQTAPWRLAVHVLGDNMLHLSLVVHHALFDGWSNQHFVAELLSNYGKFLHQEFPETRSAPPAYSTLIDLELKAIAHEPSKNFWIEQLQSASMPWWAGAKRARNQRFSYDVPQALNASVEALAQRWHVQEKCIWYTVYAALLAVITGTGKILGSAVTHSRPELENIDQALGVYLNSLPLAVDLEKKSWTEIAQSIHQTLQQQFRHRFYPAAQIQFDTGIDLSASLFNFVQLDQQPGQQNFSESPFGEESTSFPLTFSVHSTVNTHNRKENCSRIDLDVDVSLLPASLEPHLMSYVRQILSLLTAQSARQFSIEDILDESETSQLTTWNATAMAYPESQTLHGLFEAQVASAPGKTALIANGTSLSYQQLNDRANQRAAVLLSLGVAPEHCVGICLNRTAESLISILAVLKAGACYVPIDPAYPASRVQYLLNDADMHIVITTTELRERLGIDPDKCLCTDQDADVDKHTNQVLSTNLPPVNPGQLAYIIYTSGSTGRPKGVAINHQSGVSLLHWAAALLPESDRTGVLATTSFCFDLSIYEIFLPLTTGQTCILIDNILALEKLDEHSKQQITLINTVPSAAKVLLDRKAFPAGVKVLNLAGEPLKAALVDRLYTETPIAQVYDLYGPSEGTTYSSYVKRQAQGIETIGWPVANTQFYVLSPTGQLLPQGVTGELYIGGIGVARGYLQRPGLTAEKFLPDRFSPQPGSRLYRTGDLVRYLPDGKLAYLGRADHQVKVRGFRIELGEIESTCLQQPGIKDAVVIVREDQPEYRQIVAYLVPHQQTDSNSSNSSNSTSINSYTNTNTSNAALTDSLKASLQKQLPAYMMPSAFVVLSALPLTPNGKLDRAALPVPDGAEQRVGYVAPQGEVEQRVAALWEGLLRRQQVGRFDNFFELGGHSLLAMQLLARIRDAFSVELSLDQLFIHRSLRAMASCIAQTTAIVQSSSLTPATTDIKALPLALSYSQQRLWFLNQLEGPSPTYNIPKIIRLTGELNITALKQALQSIVERHESLRTSFAAQDGVPHLQIDPVHQVVLPLEEVDTIGRWHAACVEESSYCFDLGHDRLYRFKLIKQLFETAGNPYCLLATFHHSIFDGLSITVFMTELAALYTAFSENKQSQLAALPLQFSDYARWQQARLKNGEFKDQENYWRRQLAELAPSLSLPVDRPRLSQRSHAGAWVETLIDRPTTSRLKTLAHENNASLYMVLLSAFAVLLGRYSNQNDIAIGSPVANRPHSDLENVIGFFVNTLVMRCKPSDQKSFLDILTDTRAVVLKAMANQDIPFDLLVETLKPARSLSTTPLFQVMLVLVNEEEQPDTSWASVEDADDSGNLLSGSAGKQGVAHFDLTLLVKVVPGGLHCKLEYAKDLFDEDTAESMLESFKNVAGIVGAFPSSALSVFECISKQDKHQQIQTWNQTASAFKIDNCVHQLFERQAKASPDAIALVFEHQSISFRELNNRANYLAGYLLNLGMAVENRVGLYFERSIETVIAILAIIKSGGCYVPLDAGHPAERTQFILADAGVRFILSNIALPEALHSYAYQNVHVPTVLQQEAYLGIASYPDVPAAGIGLHPDNLVYWLYTSGTAGRPKGVMVRHSSLSNLCQDSIQRRGFNGECRNLQFAPVSFDAASAEIFNSLLSGSILHIPTVKVLTDAEEFSRYSKRNAVNRGYIPPAFLSVLDKKDFASYRSLSVGGEAIPKEIARQWSQVCTLTNAYGPTECTIACTSGTFDGSEDVSIGKFVANVNGYVLNEAFQLAPVGVVGELYIGGECLARGYARDKKLTAEKFLPDPFSQRPGARLYRTGDLVRYRKNGKLEFIGRKDQQVKLRGYRIELGEIEACLAAHPRIKAAAASVQGEEKDKKIVVHYVSHDNDAGVIDAGELRAFAQQSLPAYMVPAAFDRLLKLPLTANGKVDRKALPVIQFETSASVSQAPLGELEQQMAQLWAEMLGVKHIGRFDNFFELGGHSLLATQLVSRAREKFSTAITVRDLFENQTLDRFSAFVASPRHPDETSSIPALTRRGADTPSLLSPAQQRLWFLYKFIGKNAVFNIPLALQLQGSLNKEKLHAALTSIVHRHEALRARFVEVDGEARQIIDTPSETKLVEEIAENAEALRSLCHREKSTFFNLSDDTLYRFCLIKLAGSDKHVLHITFHHIVADGQSVAIFIKELSGFYNRTSGEDVVAALPFQYGDYVTWQNQAVQNQQLEEQTSYWKNALAGLPQGLELPLDFERPRAQTFSGATRKISIGHETSRQLQELSRQHSVSLFMTLISAFSVLLSRHARQFDFAIGTPISKREVQGTEQLIGLFLNSLVLRFNLNLEQSFTSLLQSTKNTTINAYRHQDVPFENLVEQLKPERSLSHTPFFQVSFSLVENPLKDMKLQGLDVSLFDMAEDEGVARYDITFNLAEIDGNIVGTMEYNTDLFKAETIERLLGHYERLLEAVVAAPQEAIGELDFLSDAERQQQLQDWNPAARTDSPQRPTSTQSVHTLFARQALHQPDAIAVVDGAHQISYRELDRRANRLAHYLLAQGVVADSCVGLCVERSADMIVGLLGILKAGAAYVPLDPAYPASRLQHMIATSACKLILSEQHLLEELSFLSDYQTLPLDGHWHHALLGRYSDTAPAVTVVPDQLAYIIFTSGSTGVPKGVLISHANITSLVAPGNSVAVPAGTIVGQAASYAFDAITYELWAPLVAGGRVVMINKATLLSPQTLTECLQQQQVSRLFITTALFNRISQETPDAFASLDQVLFGGEAYSADAIAHILHTAPPAQLLHVYGPTETTTFATGFAIDTKRFLQDRQAPIGMPMTNTTAYVLQGHHLAPLGAVGELCLGGAGLARGYLGDAQLSAKKFIPHPFAGSPGERLYRTGDLVRLRPDGAIDFIGRVDDQIKLRGFRIELGEIEQALRQHPGVEQVLVLAREDQPGERRLVAYLVAAEATETTNTAETTREATTAREEITSLSATSLAAVLSEHLKGRVPDYAVPGAFVLLDAFPLNHNGKIDRARLPVPDTSAYAREHYQAPVTSLESRLVALWQANLGQTRTAAIGTQDNYFAIGGDSIRSISLVSAARAQGLQFAIKDLFAHPTIAELASVVVDTGVAGTVRADGTVHPAGQGTDTAITSTITSPTTVPFALLSPEEQARLPRSYRGQTIEDAYPLSMLQQGMWFHSMQNPDLSLYIDVVTYRLHLQWDEQCFDRCLRYLIEKHAVLRTVFFKQSGQYLQLIKETAEMPIRYVDSRHVAPAERQLVVRQWVEAEKNRGIPSADSLWRMTVHQFDDDMLQLTFVVHHAIMDGWSVAALYAEFCELVALNRDGKELPAIVKPPVHQHLIHLENQALGRGGDYWKEKFNTAKLPWWTGARKTPSVRVFCEVSDGNAASIHALSQNLKVSDRSIWCAIYLALIATLSGSRDVVGSVVTHGRPEIEGAQDTLGLFLNTLPLRCDLNAVTWEKLITNTSQELERIYEHRHYPLAQVQVDTGLDFSATLFNYTNFHVENNVDKNTDGGFDENNFLLSVNVRKDENSGRYYCALNLEPGVFDAGFVQRIQGYVKNILGAIQAGSTQKINLSRLLQTAEIKDQLEIWNPARSAADEEHNVYQLITSSISDKPDSIAVVFGQQHYSYRALDRAASAIASHFEASGLGVGSRIGIALERSFEMLATVLACLKAGICYVPLDPQLPASRIAYIAEDADLDLMAGDVTAPLAKTAHMPGQQLKSCILAASGKAVEFKARNLHTAHLAYTIYTSGSTGKPKGVGVSHGNLINFVKSIQEQPGLQQSDRIFAVTTLSFDIAFLELFVPLAEGATVDIAHHDDVYDGKKIVNRLAAQKISFMQATPSSWKLMLDAGWQGSPGLKALVGGEALSAELAEKLVSRIDHLWNMYGPTETTIWSTTRQIHGARVDIGKPLRNTTVYVLNEALDLLPTGVIGELYIGGDGVASGYVKRPGLTAARFIPNPFAGEANSGGRIYRTGDLVRYLENGNVEYVGRADQQVKVRGYRVELGEIEKTILQTSLVKDAVVVLRGDESGNQIIVAYLVILDALDTSNTSAQADMTAASDSLTQEDARNKLAQAIRDKLKTSLPDYMLPSAFVVMDEFPLTPNGKLDRKALPSPRDALVTASYVAADGEIEERIAAIWAQILKREKIGRYSNFFELGGHSLLITQLASRIEDEFEIKVALKDFYEFPTLCEIASRIQYLSMLETMDEDLVAELSDEEVLTILSELDEIGSVSAKNQPVANQS